MGVQGDDDQGIQSCSYAGWLNSGDLLYNVTIVNNTALYTWNLLEGGSQLQVFIKEGGN